MSSGSVRICFYLHLLSTYHTQRVCALYPTYTPQAQDQNASFRDFQSPLRVASALLWILCGASRKWQHLTHLQPSSSTLRNFTSSGLTAQSGETVHFLHKRVHQQWFASARNGKIHCWQFHTCHHQSTSMITERRISFDYRSISSASALPVLRYLDN